MGKKEKRIGKTRGGDSTEQKKNKKERKAGKGAPASPHPDSFKAGYEGAAWGKVGHSMPPEQTLGKSKFCPLPLLDNEAAFAVLDEG